METAYESDPISPSQGLNIPLALQVHDRELRRIVTRAADALCFVDEDGHLLEVNRQGHLTLGYSTKDIAELSVFDIAPDLKPEEFRNLIDRLESESCLTFERRFRRKDGSYLPVEIRMGPVHIARKRTILVAARDITDLEQVKERSALEGARERQRTREAESGQLALFTHVPIGLYRSTVSGEILAANPAAARILGYDDSQSLVGQNAREFYVESPERQEWLRQIELKNGVVEGHEMRFRRRDGRTIWVRNGVRAVHGGDGKILFYEGAIEDISTQRAAEEALRQSERYYRALLAGSSDPVTVIDRAGRRRYVGPAIEAILGYRPEELIGVNPLDLIHSDEAPLVAEAFARSLADPAVPVHVVYRARRKDGSWRWIEAVGRNLLNDPDVEGVVVAERDVTDRRRAEEEIRHHIQLAEFAADAGRALSSVGTIREVLGHCSRLMVDHLGAAFARIWTLDEEDDVLVLQASSGMYTHLDGPHARVPVGSYKIGRIARDRKPHLSNQVVTDPEVSDPEWARREGMVAFAGYPLIVEERLVGVMAMFSRHALDDAALQAMAAVAHSVAIGIVRQRKEEALGVAVRKAEESDRLKTAFLANISHEVRTPLNVILGNNSLIAEQLADLHDETLTPCLEAVGEGSNRLLQTIEGIVDLSRFETGTFVVRHEPVNVIPLLEKSVRRFRKSAERKHLSLTLEIDVPEVEVQADEYCLERSFDHLLDNAIKFTEQGGVTVRLHRDPSGQLCLTIRDTGVGIDPSYVPNLFKPFSQEQGGYTRPFEGPGIGLALVKRYLGVNHAQITLQSEKGKGTTFAIRFPDSTGSPGEDRPTRGGLH